MSSLLEETVTAHGGLERWAAVDVVRLRLETGGPAFASRGRPRAMRGVDVTIATGEQRVVFDPFPRPGARGVFTAAEARIEDGDRVVARTDAPHGLLWSAADVLAFTGAALWTYVAFPFVLVQDARLRVRELPGRRLHVAVGEGIRSHAREHVLWIGADGLIDRHDYTPDAFGRLARAANLCLEHQTIDGLVLATRRRVVPRALGNRPLPGPPLVRISLRPPDGTAP